MFFSALTYGHGVGDKALQEIANKLKKQFGTGNSVIRLGGDEFVVLLPRMLENQFTFIQKKVQLINTELQNPQNNLPKMSVSAGVAFSTKGYSEDLYKRADAALYVTKQTGMFMPGDSMELIIEVDSAVIVKEGSSFNLILDGKKVGYGDIISKL